MKLNLAKLISSFASNSSIATPFLVVASIFVTIYTGGVVKSSTEAVAAITTNPAPIKMSMAKAPITKGEVKAAAERIQAISPSISLSVSGSSLTLSAKSPDLFPEFMAAISAAMNADPSILWEAKSICLNACESGNSARAVITGFKQSLKTTS